MKRFLLTILVVLIILSTASCAIKNTINTTDYEEYSKVTESQTEQTKESELCTTAMSETTYTYVETQTEEKTTTTENDVSLWEYPHDPTSHKIGSYINLIYDDEFCDVTYHVEKDIGTREIINLSVSMKKDVYFAGWYKDNFNEDNLVGQYVNYMCATNTETNLYINYAVKVTYHTDELTYEDFYPIAYYKCPVALNAKTFSKDGYVLSEYVTDTGYHVSPGSRFPINSANVDVHCIWEKVNNKSDFTYVGSTILKYTGTSSNVVIPEAIDGAQISHIAPYAFDNDNIERIFIPSTITSIDSNAICSSSVKEIVLHDGITKMSNDSINCPNLTNVRINSIRDFYKEPSKDGDVVGTYIKYDRLVWAQNYKKIIVYGASGSLYGWDSEELTKEFGNEYVIINLGMNANMCSSLVFEGITPLLNEGDIILWAAEPGNKVLGDTNFDFQTTWWFTASYYDLYKNVDISAYSNVFDDNFARFNYEKIRNNCSYSYSETYKSNIYGDNIKYRPNNYVYCGNYNFDYFTNYDYSHMSEVINKLNQKGVKVLFTYASYINEEDGGATASELDFYKSKILENFNVTIISDYTDCGFSISYFWNSEWHLTLEGAHLRTLKVIEDLKQYFNNN